MKLSRWAIRTSTLLAAVAFVAVCGSLVRPAAATTLNINIGLGNPDFVVVPGSQVYYIHDSDRDIYRYGNRYYVTDGRTWYRCRTTSGPFRSFNSRYLPREVSRGRAIHDRRGGNARYNEHGNGHDNGKHRGHGK